VESLLRAWTWEDAPALAAHANNRRVARNMRDAFPFPYTLEDARRFLAEVTPQRPLAHMALQLDGQAIGGIGLQVGHDVERISAEVGYWVAEAYWGQGFASRALVAFADYALAAFPGLNRLYAVPFLRNLRSQRVLEKAGFRREGILSESAVKDGVLESQALYAITRAEWTARVSP